MAIIDIVKYEQQEGVIVHKFLSCDLRWGSQLVVYPGQVAFFVKGGTVCDKFTDGTYTLKSNNIPLLNKIINLPFGGDSPFQADVWFSRCGQTCRCQLPLLSLSVILRIPFACFDLFV